MECELRSSEWSSVAQFRQANKGATGPNTKYRKITREKFSVGLLVDNDLVQSDAKSDGIVPA